MREALKTFALTERDTESAAHIKPLHWYVACRLVLEGGFNPDEIMPRPPFAVERKGGRIILHYDPKRGGWGERTILGGLKTKNVDVVVTKNGLGPCIAVSLKGALRAFRNLTNRMEEAVGDCTNLHITYPALVYGFLVVLRGNRRSPVIKASAQVVEGEQKIEIKTADAAIREGGEPAEMIVRFHSALRELTGRRGIRNDVSRYEAIGFGLVDPSAETIGRILDIFPPEDSPLRVEKFFNALYLRYDERYVYGAPDLNTITRRLEWSPRSPVFVSEGDLYGQYPKLDYHPRLAVS
jgi:hypothetical protein